MTPIFDLRAKSENLVHDSARLTPLGPAAKITVQKIQAGSAAHEAADAAVEMNEIDEPLTLGDFAA
jgi:hypothetical protein